MLLLNITIPLPLHILLQERENLVCLHFALAAILDAKPCRTEHSRQKTHVFYFRTFLFKIPKIIANMTKHGRNVL